MFARVGYRACPEVQQICTFTVCVIDFGQEVGPAAVSQCGSRTLPTVILDEFKKLETEIFLLWYESERKRQVSPVSSIVQFNGLLVKNLNILFRTCCLDHKSSVAAQ